MTPVPIATFLAGSLLSLLLPVLLLTALVIWYVHFLRRAPGPADGSESATPAAVPTETATADTAPPPKEV